MDREIKNITRDLADIKNSDIIFKKDKIQKILEEDPDLKSILGIPDKIPLNKYKDPENPTPKEKQRRQEIIDFNENRSKDIIVPYLKLNDTQTDVKSYVMFDIDDIDIDDYNNTIKVQYLIVMCVVHEDAMDTEYSIPRADLLSYIIKDLFSGSNVLGKQMMCLSDRPQTMDNQYYCRTIRFKTTMPNTINGHMTRTNKYDRFTL